MAKIVYVYQAQYPDDVRVRKICVSLAGAGHEVLVVCRRYAGEAQEDKISGYHVFRIGSDFDSLSSLPFPGNPKWRSGVFDACRRFKPDLVIAREIVVAEFAHAAATRLDVPWIIDMAEHYPAAMREWKKYTTNPLLRFLVHTVRLPDMFERRFVKRCNGVVTVCSENQNRLIQSYGLTGEDTCVVQNTPILSEFETVTVPTGSDIVIGHHGFFTEERNLVELVKGFLMIAVHEPKLRLELAGHGETFEDVRNLVHAHKAHDLVRLPGKYRQGDLNRFYSGTHYGVLPYKIDEFRNHTIANKLFDYMACGIPTLVSLNPPMKRIVETERCGLSAQANSPEAIAESIRRLLMLDRDELAVNARKAAVEKYNWSVDFQIFHRFVLNLIR